MSIFLCHFPVSYYYIYDYYRLIIIDPAATITPGWFPNLTRAYDNNGRCPRQKFVFGILQLGWFPNFTRAYDNNGRCPRQKFVFGILQLDWFPNLTRAYDNNGRCPR